MGDESKVKSRSGWCKLVVALVVVGAMCQVTFMQKNEVLAGATAAQGNLICLICSLERQAPISHKSIKVVKP